MQCPCHSGKSYQACCVPLHRKERLPESAEQLMRSRYSAYALQLPEYIMDTTHPENPTYLEDRSPWQIEILKFCKETTFTGLDILSTENRDDEAFVTFFAHLIQNNLDVSFQEKSRFLKEDGRWLYRSGIRLT
ncbi:MAG: hypothetical protein KR126chlam1_01274 [Chlamydiae bacterium]|nr:hypothetical protein [Chlamydiota bacterium]